MRYSVPFEIKGLDSDNGGEFINEHLYHCCLKEKITFTRARSSRKNDNCYVEQKNWSVVRRAVGYKRFDTELSCKTLNVFTTIPWILKSYNSCFYSLRTRKGNTNKIIKTKYEHEYIVISLVFWKIEYEA